MEQFWRHGYAASSMEDVVQATGATRHTIYLEFGGKEQLFEHCLIAYCTLVVTPAFARVENGDERIRDIAGYFEHQIRRAGNVGLPGPGCLMANTMTEVAPHSARAAELVHEHLERLRVSFERALSRPRPGKAGKWLQIQSQAHSLAVFANGLWSVSRITKDPAQLRRSVGAMLHAIERDI